MRRVREPLAEEGDECQDRKPRMNCSRSLSVTWIGLPLRPAPLPRAAASSAIAGLGGDGSCVVDDVGLARLARNCAAIFSLLDCGGEGGGGEGSGCFGILVGVVSDKGGEDGIESRRDCRLRTARSMEGSRPELARASRYNSKASSE